MEWREAITFEEHIMNMLRDGKRIDHPDFQPWITLHGQARIESMIKSLLGPPAGPEKQLETLAPTGADDDEGDPWKQ